MYVVVWFSCVYTHIYTKRVYSMHLPAARYKLVCVCFNDAHVWRTHNDDHTMAYVLFTAVAVSMTNIKYNFFFFYYLPSSEETTRKIRTRSPD